jgi:hypothetical protein
MRLAVATPKEDLIKQGVKKGKEQAVMNVVKHGL